MKYKQRIQSLLTNKMPSNLLKYLPSSYSVTGDIAIFHKLPKQLENYKQLIGQTTIGLDPRVNVVIEQITTETIFRKPVINLISGEKRTTTIHHEFHTIFNIDVSKITFSPGNKGERERLLRLVQDNEVIIDMFACIGNLSLPIAVNKPEVTVYGIEINKKAYDYLIKNIHANKVEKRYIPIFGDNRLKTPENGASRVLMGCFKIDQKQFDKAVNAIHKEGWIHYHSTAPRNENEQLEKFVEKMQEILSFKIQLLSTRRVKKFSPRLYHLCTDIYIEKL